MSWKEKEGNFVYWYHLEEHTDMSTQGYIGVTKRLKQRHWQHTKWKGTTCLVLRRAFEKYGEEDIVKDIILEGTEEECLAYELELRPTKSIGWNIAVGGGKAPDCTGRVHSQETKDKISAGNKGKNLGKVSPFKGVTGRYSEETLQAIGKAQKDKTISDEHKRIITEKNSGANNVNSKFIVLEHKDSEGTTHKFDTVKEAADSTEVGYSAIRNTIRRNSQSYNKKGWRIRFDLSHPELGQR